jgi:TPR repeat protein
MTALMSQWSPAHMRGVLSESPQHAAAWARVLALEGMSQAQVCYGRMLLEGTGTIEDKDGAYTWFKRAAEQGDLDGLNMTGRCLENGWGTSTDVSAAADAYRQAADAGHAWAQYNLGHLYLDGIGVAQDFGLAYGYYRRAAEQQHERAMNLVGRCCEEGWGTVRDFTAAAHWYQRSAQSGYFRGEYNWASILLKFGRDGEAVVWFERAARGGTPALRHTVLELAAAWPQSAAMAALAARLRTDAGLIGA